MKHVLALLVLPACAALIGCDNYAETTRGTGADRETVALAPQAEHHDHHQGDAPVVKKTVCVLLPVADSGVNGVIHFDQTSDGIHVHGEVTGLTPGKHGFHIHEFGDITNREDGLSTGGHFDPEGHEHGFRDAEVRHVGDLGNIEANEEGVATIDFVDNVLQFSGVNSIIGRGVVVHAKEDVGTQPTGDAGGRVGIGVVGIAKSE